MVTHNVNAFVLSTIPIMIFFGIRHALDVDHITAIDNLVRMHNVRKRARWVGTGFSLGHSTSIFLELVIIIYICRERDGWKNRHTCILGRYSWCYCFSGNWRCQYVFNEKMGKDRHSYSCQ
jgi:high-affinity nickel permease